MIAVLSASVLAQLLKISAYEVCSLLALYLSLVTYFRVKPRETLPTTTFRLKRVGDHHFSNEHGEIIKEPSGWYAYPKGQPEVGPFYSSRGAVGALLSISDNSQD